MKANELRELGDDELRQRLSDARESLLRFRMQRVTGALENTKGPGNTRRDIARIQTILRERELAAKGKS